MSPTHPVLRVSAFLTLLPMLFPPPAAANEPAAAKTETEAEVECLTVLDRDIALERGEWMAWRVDYLLRHDGLATLVIEPENLAARVAGWVSNSRADGHAVPRRSEVEATGGTGLRGESEVIASTDEARRCHERLVVRAWPAELGRTPPETAEEPAALEIAPAGALRVRIGLEHEHHLCGRHTALLGERDLTLQLGTAVLHDRLPLDRQGRVDVPAVSWPPTLSAEFLDNRIFLTAPDSLHLEAHIPGKRSYRFPEYREVVGGSRLRLSFWYLVAPGTEGTCQARITQARSLPNSYKILYDGESVATLPIRGRWVQVERIVQVEPEATILTLDVRINESKLDMGELWIDNVQLEPYGDDILAGP